MKDEDVFRWRGARRRLFAWILDAERCGICGLNESSADARPSSMGVWTIRVPGSRTGRESTARQPRVRVATGQAPGTPFQFSYSGSRVPESAL